MKTLTIFKQAPGLFDYVNRMAELQEHCSSFDWLTMVSFSNQPWIDSIKSSIGRNFVRPWKKTLEGLAQGPGGRPRYEVVMVFKILVLQRYYNLSEEQTGYQIKDRLSFQKFLGLTFADAVADKNTIGDFKQRLIEAGVMEKLERFKEHLKDQGLIAQDGETPEKWEDQAAKLRPKDTDARWAKKGEEVHFGYKNHVKVDEKSKLIEKYEVTDASVHDSQKIEDLVEKGDGRVHGDSAYRSAQIEKDLEEKEVESRIHEKGYRNRPLTEEQKENNRQKSRVRARIENVFGYMTNSMGGVFYAASASAERRQRLG